LEILQKTHARSVLVRLATLRALCRSFDDTSIGIQCFTFELPKRDADTLQLPKKNRSNNFEELMNRDGSHPYHDQTR
jgi:hypothetical protein